ncbi:diguanylate cyclase domain-containing protein, partial [Ensifer sp. P24N7]|uniref:diguanylate cyclase domain-containing protein n=1 Tax=Sinorhizobium sp. P24N7 TaxID=3348358 RepID=UPI0035F4C5B7
DIWLEVHVAPTPVGISIFFRDTSERRKAEEERVLAQKQIHHMARHDALTGLPNRQFLREVFAQALNGPGATRSAALSLDLDGFKSVNDAYGHPTGDLLLRHVADRLRTCVDETDVVGRLGGDEFIVLKPDIGR